MFIDLIIMKNPPFVNPKNKIQNGTTDYTENKLEKFKNGKIEKWKIITKNSEAGSQNTESLHHTL